MIAKPKVGTNINKLETFFVYFQYIKFRIEIKIKFHEKLFFNNTKPILCLST